MTLGNVLEDVSGQVTNVADRIEGVPLPQEHTLLLGQDALANEFCRQYASGRIHHAFLITGQRGGGKATLAWRLAWHVLSSPDAASAKTTYKAPEINDPVFSRMARGGHPNLLCLQRPWQHDRKKFATQLTVDEVRRTVGFFGNSRSENAWRVCIVDSADELNASAANALLKILEEPPERTLFFVLSHSPGKLLPTIRSRCQSLRVNPLQASEIAEVLGGFGMLENIMDGGKTEEDIALTAELAGGSVRKALLLLEHDGLELYRTMLRLGFEEGAANWPDIHKFAGQLALRSEEEKYQLFLELLQDEITRQMHMEVQHLDEGNGNGSSLSRWPDTWSRIGENASVSDEYNLDRKQVVLSVFDLLLTARAR